MDQEKVVYRPVGAFEDQVYYFDNLKDVEIIYAEDNETILEYRLINQEDQVFDAYREYVEIHYKCNATKYIMEYLRQANGK